MKQPAEGGSYVYDPAKDQLKQVEKPTEHLNPNDSPADAAASAANPSSIEADASKKGSK